MFTLTLQDNQQATVTSNPKTQSGLASPNPFNFNVTNPNTAVLDVIITQGSNPTFLVRPKGGSFFGTRSVDLTLHALKFNQGAAVDTPMTVVINGTALDDGTLDHFEPSASDPVPQS